MAVLLNQLIRRLPYILILLILSTTVTAANPKSTAKSIFDCTPGFLFCEYYGCQQVPMCPQVCETIADPNTCTRSYNGVACKWDNGLCSRDVKCENNGGACSADCMHCNTFGCVPKSSQCPKACPLYSDSNSCKAAPKSGTSSCEWSENRCQTRDESDPSKSSSSSSSSAPSATPSQSEEDPIPDPDFGNITSKRAWAGTIGIIIGVIFGILGLLGVIFLVWLKTRQRRQRLASEASMHSNHNSSSGHRPQSFIHALRSVVNHNARELDAVPPLSPLPAARSTPR